VREEKVMGEKKGTESKREVEKKKSPLTKRVKGPEIIR